MFKEKKTKLMTLCVSPKSLYLYPEHPSPPLRLMTLLAWQGRKPNRLRTLGREGKNSSLSYFKIQFIFYTLPALMDSYSAIQAS